MKNRSPKWVIDVITGLDGCRSRGLNKMGKGGCNVRRSCVAMSENCVI